MDLILRGVAGGALIIVVLFLARGSHSSLAGLLALFPAVTAISYFMIGSSEGSDQLQSVVKSSLIALPVLIVYIGATYLALRLVDYRLAILIGIAAWIVAGAVFFLIIER